MKSCPDQKPPDLMVGVLYNGDIDLLRVQALQFSRCLPAAKIILWTDPNIVIDRKKIDALLPNAVVVQCPEANLPPRHKVIKTSRRIIALADRLFCWCKGQEVGKYLLILHADTIPEETVAPEAILSGKPIAGIATNIKNGSCDLWPLWVLYDLAACDQSNLLNRCPLDRVKDYSPTPLEKDHAAFGLRRGFNALRCPPLGIHVGRPLPLEIAAERLGITVGEALRYAKAIARWTAAGFPARSQDEVERIYYRCCLPCEFFENGRCKDCGCRVNCGPALWNKIRMATEDCPRGKWSVVRGQRGNGKP